MSSSRHAGGSNPAPRPRLKRWAQSNLPALLRPKAHARPLPPDAQVWRPDASLEKPVPLAPPAPHSTTSPRSDFSRTHDTHRLAGEAREIAADHSASDLASRQMPGKRAHRLPPSPAERMQMPAFPVLDEAHIHIPDTPESFAQARKALLGAQALGFDTESKPLFTAGQRDDGPHLVQLATVTDAWLLQLHHPAALALTREVMAVPHIVKVGFGLANDRRSLPHRLGTKLVNVQDLDRIFSQHGFGTNLGVKGAAAVVLGTNFQKSKKVSTTNWAAAQLSPAQRRYAANDAHGPAMIWAALPAWEAAQPPLPGRQ